MYQAQIIQPPNENYNGYQQTNNDQTYIYYTHNNNQYQMNTSDIMRELYIFRDCYREQPENYNRFDNIVSEVNKIIVLNYTLNYTIQGLQHMNTENTNYKNLYEPLNNEIIIIKKSNRRLKVMIIIFIIYSMISSYFVLKYFNKI